MVLDIPLRKTNTGQKSLSFLMPKICSKIDTSIKNVRKLCSFMHAIKKKHFTLSAKVIQVVTILLCSILLFDSLIATLFLLVILGILLGRSSHLTS